MIFSSHTLDHLVISANGRDLWGRRREGKAREATEEEKIIARWEADRSRAATLTRAPGPTPRATTTARGTMALLPQTLTHTTTPTATAPTTTPTLMAPPTTTTATDLLPTPLLPPGSDPEPPPFCSILMYLSGVHRTCLVLWSL